MVEQTPMTKRRMAVPNMRISEYLLKMKGIKYLAKAFLMTSYLGCFTFLVLTQKAISALPSWILFPSRVKAGMNRVI